MRTLLIGLMIVGTMFTFGSASAWSCSHSTLARVNGEEIWYGTCSGEHDQWNVAGRRFEVPAPSVHGGANGQVITVFDDDHHGLGAGTVCYAVGSGNDVAQCRQTWR